jgi:hypothetical protein
MFLYKTPAWSSDFVLLSQFQSNFTDFLVSNSLLIEYFSIRLELGLLVSPVSACTRSLGRLLYRFPQLCYPLGRGIT